MTSANKVGYMLGLLVIGAASFAIFGALYAARMGTPLHLEKTVGPGDPATAMRDGATAALRKATEALGKGRRAEAMHAMDAAGRVIEVGAEAFGGRWHEAAKDLHHAKRSMANGRPAVAADAMHAATEKLGEAGAVARAPDQVKDLSAYRGATLINAAGVHIGEVKAPRAKDGNAGVILGGVQDLFGFWDLGGQRVQVPARRLVYGPAQWPQPTLVVLPTLASEPAEIHAQLQLR